MRRYTNLNEAIQTEIVDVIEAGGGVTDAHAEFDIDRISELVLADALSGYALKAWIDTDEFWRIVENHAR